MPVLPNKALTTTYSIQEAKTDLGILVEGYRDGKPTGFFSNLLTWNWSDICYFSHLVAVSRGWWHEKDGVTLKERNFGEIIALVHSEVSEALEGFRSSLPSDHIPGFSMFEEEVGDTLIRFGDLCFAMGVPNGTILALGAKLIFNITRQDHSREYREGEKGKSF